jgi:RecA/RadA recombinase
MKKKKKSEVVEEEPKKKKKLKKTVEIKEEGFGDEPSNPFKADWKFMLSTGSTLLDLAISGKRKKFGGIPTGILVEISGKSGAGKTAILTELCASAQKKGGEAYFNDPEARLDKEYAKITGYSLTDEKLYDRPDTVTALFDNFKSWKVNPEVPNVFAGDSLAALSTNTEMEDEDKMGMRRAKEFSQELRKSARMFSKKNVLMACSNQLRDSPTGKTTPGGNAIPFYSSLRMEVMPHFPTAKVKREKTINGVKHSKVIGIQSDVTIIKNSLDDPFRKVPIYIIFGYGIDDVRGNLMWLKESTGEKKFIFDNKEFSRIEDAIAFVEENNLEKKLRKKVVDLWNELEEAFKTNRKPKAR